MAHLFSESCVMIGHETEPYWRDVGTVDAFWRANIDLTDFVPELDLYDNSWPIWTYTEAMPPAKFIHDEDGAARLGGVVAGLGRLHRVGGRGAQFAAVYRGQGAQLFSELDHVVALPYVDVGARRG